MIRPISSGMLGRVFTQSTLLHPILALVLGATSCRSDPKAQPPTKADLALAANESSRLVLGTAGPGVPVTAPGASAAQTEESAARRAATRRSVLAARRDQDEAFARRSDDASFLGVYEVKNRKDVVELYLRGRAYALLDRLREAMTEFEAAVAADANHPFPRLGLAGCFAKREEHDRAIVELQRCIRLDPDLAEAHWSLARSYNSLNRLEEAIASAETCARVDDDPARSAELLCELWRRRNLPEKAIEVLREAIQRKPSDVLLRLKLADALEKSGKPDAAAKELDELAEKATLPVEQLLAYASVYRSAERFEKAVELLEKLLKEAPESYWKLQPRADIERLLEVVREEKRAGRRRSYPPRELVNILSTHSDPERRLFAARELVQWDGRDVLNAYVKALQDRSAAVRAIALTEVASRAADAGADRVIAQLASDDPDPIVRIAACTALGKGAWAASEAALLKALLDKDAKVRGAANRALEVYCGGRILYPNGLDDATIEEAQAARVAWEKALIERKKAPDGGSK